MGENLSFGKSRGDEYMTSLFIDDGVKNRGHRLAIQSTRYELVGLAYCPHNSDYFGMVAIAYATGFELNAKGKQEIDSRFASRRVGSNLNLSNTVSTGAPTTTVPQVVTPSVPTSTQCTAHEKIDEGLAEWKQVNKKEKLKTAAIITALRKQ